jgi:hypothetical protein
MKVTVTKANYYRYEEDVPVVQVGVFEGEDIKNAPLDFSVRSVMPNPFAGNTEICYGLPMKANSQVTIYDVSGKLVTTLHSGIQQPGWHIVTWNGGDERNNRSPSGIYFCEIRTEYLRIVTKLILLK